MPSHSITSSARSRNDSGMVRPIALAALRLITIAYFVGYYSGRSAGLRTLKDAIDVGCRASELVEIVGAPGHQAPPGGEEAERTDGREAVAGRPSQPPRPPAGASGYRGEPAAQRQQISAHGPWRPVLKVVLPRSWGGNSSATSCTGIPSPGHSDCRPAADNHGPRSV
jgi:hypothetical protein